MFDYPPFVPSAALRPRPNPHPRPPMPTTRTTPLRVRPARLTPPPDRPMADRVPAASTPRQHNGNGRTPRRQRNAQVPAPLPEQHIGPEGPPLLLTQPYRPPHAHGEARFFPNAGHGNQRLWQPRFIGMGWGFDGTEARGRGWGSPQRHPEHENGAFYDAARGWNGN